MLTEVDLASIRAIRDATEVRGDRYPATFATMVGR